MSTAPNVNNYSIPRGTVSFTPTGGSLTVLGNCPQFRYTIGRHQAGSLQFATGHPRQGSLGRHAARGDHCDGAG